MSTEATPPAAEAIAEVKPTPAPETPPAEKPVDQEISDGIRSLLKDRLKGKPTPKEEKKKEEAKPKAEEKPKEEVKPEVKPEEKPKEEKAKVKVSRKAPAPDVKTIAAEAATAATREALKAAEAATIKKPGQTKPQIEVDIERLPEEYREDIPVLRRMEEKWPEKYKGLTDKYVKASSRIEAYREKWLQDNPGQQFDPEAQEHASFIESNEVDWSDRDYARTLSSIETESALEQERKKVNEKLEEVESKLVEKELEPAIRSRQSEISRGIISAIDKEFVGIIGDNGTVNRKEIDRLREIDPFRTDTLLAAVSNTSRFIDVAERIFHPSGRFKADKANPAHVDAARFLIAIEDEITAGGEDYMVRQDGKVFVTRHEWAAMDANQRRRHWRLEKDDLIALKEQEQAAIAKQKIEDWDSRFQKMLSARGYKKVEGTPDAQETKGKTKEAAPPPPKPSAPSATEGVKVDTTTGGTTKPEDDFRTKLKAGLRGRTMR